MKRLVLTRLAPVLTLIALAAVCTLVSCGDGSSEESLDRLEELAFTWYVAALEVGPMADLVQAESKRDRLLSALENGQEDRAVRLADHAAILYNTAADRLASVSGDSAFKTWHMIWADRLKALSSAYSDLRQALQQGGSIQEAVSSIDAAEDDARSAMAGWARAVVDYGESRGETVPEWLRSRAGP